MKTASQVIDQLDAIRVEIHRTADELRKAETGASQADVDLKTAFAVAYRSGSGSVRDREQNALLETVHLLKARNDAAAALAYVKARRSNLEIEQSNLQTQARLLIDGREAR